MAAYFVETNVTNEGHKRDEASWPFFWKLLVDMTKREKRRGFGRTRSHARKTFTLLQMTHICSHNREEHTTSECTQEPQQVDTCNSLRDLSPERHAWQHPGNFLAQRKPTGRAVGSLTESLESECYCNFVIFLYWYSCTVQPPGLVAT